MTTSKSTRRDNNIIPIEGAKGTSYKVLIRKQGFATISQTFATRKEAREFRDKVKGSKDLMTRLGGSGSRLTLANMIEKYMEQYRGRDKSVSQKCGVWKERLGNWRLADITRHTIAEELDKLKTEPALQPLRKHESKETTRPRSEATVNRYHATLSGIFKLAIAKGFIDENPARGISRGGETSRFGRALSDDERTTLLEKCKQSEWDRLYLLVTLALSTGARCGELFSLTWNDIDVKKGVAKLVETKNGSPRHLPIIPSVLELIKALPRPIDGTVFLFPSETDLHKSYYSGFRKHWDKALQDAGVDNFRFHDLRHSAASFLTEKGVPLVAVAEILGHKTMAMVQRYSHVHTAQKAKIVEDAFKDLLG